VKQKFMKWHELTEQEAIQSLNVDIKKGLSEKEAENRRKKLGYNELAEGKRQSNLLLFFGQFKDFMVLVLIAATVISGLLGEYIDAVAIIAIVILNGVLGFIQEKKAEKSLAALKELSSPQTTVLRSGKWVKIPSREIVVGDCIKFKSGDRIGADVRLIQVSSLEVEESALTGESVPVGKHTRPLKGNQGSVGDMQNMAFMGTLVTRGSGVGVVVATGMKTAMGQIADLLQTQEQQLTPMQRKLEELGKVLIVVALLLTVLVAGIGVMQGHAVYEMFLAGVSLAVAAIPEGLPAIVTVALALGVQRMIKKNSIVRKLPAVETLGCATVICSDKTGTMTQNQMTVTDIWISNKSWKVTGAGYQPAGEFFENGKKIDPAAHKPLKQMLMFGMLASTSDIIETNGEYSLDGDPTEGALIVAGMKAGLAKSKLLKQFHIMREFPFDSDRKMMSVIVQDKDGKCFAVAKGAPDVILERSTHVLWHDRKERLTEQRKNDIQKAIFHQANEALRTIAVAYKPLHTGSLPQAEAESSLIFIGIQGMIDPPRPEVKQAVKECGEAGIKTVMITGDHVITAQAIAKELEILPPNGKVMDGSSLSKLTIEELEEVVDDIYVFARVSPEHKLKIVKALQNKGHIVAMTGDGVNDAPAIKAADIGISMGMSGTDVAKEASSLILVDDNFATIKAAIQEGRNIYDNIRKFIRYLLASNVGEILVMLFAMILALPLPLVPIQILWVNLVTDGLPAMALGLDPAEEDVLKRKPRDPKEGIFSRGLGWKILSRGFLIGLSTLLVFYFIYERNTEQLAYAQTAAFATLVLSQLILVFDSRTEKTIFDRNPFSNIYLLLAVFSSIILMLVVIYYEPLQPIFHTTPIMARDWLFIFVMSALPTFLLAGSILTRKKR